MIYDGVWRERYNHEIKRFGHAVEFSPERERYREHLQTLLSPVGRAFSQRAQRTKRDRPKLNPGKSNPLVNLLARVQVFIGLILVGIAMAEATGLKPSYEIACFVGANLGGLLLGATLVRRGFLAVVAAETIGALVGAVACVSLVASGAEFASVRVWSKLRGH